MRVTRVALGLFVLATTLASPGALTAQTAQPVTALVGARVYPDPNGVPIDDAIVSLVGGRISAVGPRAAVAVPPGAKVIDVKVL